MYMFLIYEKNSLYWKEYLLHLRGMGGGAAGKRAGVEDRWGIINVAVRGGHLWPFIGGGNGPWPFVNGGCELS